jgi:hypothetical protein
MTLYHFQQGLVQSKVSVPHNLYIDDNSYVVTDTNIIVQYKKNAETNILDNTGQLIDKLRDLEGNEIRGSQPVCLGRGQIALLSESSGGYHLGLWNTENPKKLTCLKRRLVPFLSPFFRCRPNNLKLDEQFIVVSGHNFSTKKKIFFFVTTETLEIKGQREIPSARDNEWAYGQGLLLVFNVEFSLFRCFGHIRMYSVSSNKFLGEIPTKIARARVSDLKLEHYVGFNSHFMIVPGESDYDPNKSTLKINDLESIKNPESKDTVAFRNLDLDFPVRRMAVDDTRIVFSTFGGIQIFEFLPKKRRTVACQFWSDVFEDWRMQLTNHKPVVFECGLVRKYS